MSWFQNVLGMPGAVLGGVGSYASAINPFNSLNAFRLSGDYRYNETRLEQMSPKHKEVMINSYNGTLGIPEPQAFQNHVEKYLTTQDEALAKKVDDPKKLSSEQKKTYDDLEDLKTALRKELKAFTAKIKNLPSNTHAEALTGTATEEKTLIIAKLKLLSQRTEAFTTRLEKDKSPSATNTASTTTPGASTGAGTGAGGVGTGAGTGTGVGSGTGTNTTATNIPDPSETSNYLDEDAANKLNKDLGALSDKLDSEYSTPELDELEKQLTGTITDMHRAAQLERDRIPLFATLHANRRKQSLFTRTIDNMSEKGISGLWSYQEATPPSVLYTGDDQPGVEKLRKAMRLLDLPGQAQEALKEAKDNLEKTETRLKKATDDNDQDKIEQYKKEKEDYEKEINKLSQERSPENIKQAADLINGQAGFLGLIGYNPGLTALSGKKITVAASDQGLGFQMHLPRPIFDPGYYTSSEHNTKADLVCMAELVKATGAQTITSTVRCDNPKMAQRLAQEAYEAALEVGYEDKDITIIMNGKEMTQEALYQHLDNQSNKDTGKYMAKQQRAKKLDSIAKQGRQDAKKNHGTEINEQQASLKNALKSGRDELEAAFKNDSNTPTAPTTSIVGP